MQTDRKSHNNEKREKCELSSSGIAEGIRRASCQQGTGCFVSFRQTLQHSSSPPASSGSSTPRNNNATCISSPPVQRGGCRTPGFDKCFIVYAVSVSLSSPSVSPLCSSPACTHTDESVGRLASFLPSVVLSVSRAFDVCLHCCSWASLG